MELLKQIAAVCGSITSIAAAVTLLVKPIRERVLGIKKLRESQDASLADIKEGQKCLLRSEMLQIYYNGLDASTLRQYAFENFMMLYNAYKALGGNSFIDKVKEEVKEWKVIS